MKSLQNGKKTTIMDVALLAGVSSAAVSKVLNGGKGRTVKVGDATAEQIRKAAEQLGYMVNRNAQCLVTGRTGFIGFMLSPTVHNGWLNPYFASYLQGVEEGCRRNGYGLAVSRTTVADAKTFIHSDLLSHRRIDGLIVAGELEVETYRELCRSGIPFIILNAPHRKGFPIVNEENDFRTIMEYVYSKGHRKVAFTRDWHNGMIPDYIRDVITDMAGRGCSVASVEPREGMHSNWECGFGLGDYLFERWVSERWTLIISNSVLGEFYRRLVKNGFQCPEDVSLLGDNSYDLGNSSIDFTVCEKNHMKIGADAVEMLSKAIESGIPLSDAECAKLHYKITIREGETVI